MRNKIKLYFLLVLGLAAVPFSVNAECETVTPRLSPCMHCGKAGVMPASDFKTITLGYERVACVHGMTGLDDKITYADQSGALCTYCGQMNWFTTRTYSEYHHLVP